MTAQHYTSIPIMLSKKQMQDLLKTHTQHIEKADTATLETLRHLVSAIITQSTNLCIQHKIPRNLPVCITVTPILPITQEKP
jgi:hypothetical protein